MAFLNAASWMLQLALYATLVRVWGGEEFGCLVHPWWPHGVVVSALASHAKYAGFNSRLG